MPRAGDEQRDQGRDDQEPGRLPGGDAEVAVDQQAEQPDAAARVVRVEADHAELAGALELVAAGVRGDAAVDRLVHGQVDDPAGGERAGEDGGGAAPVRPPQAARGDQVERGGDGGVLHRQPGQRDDRQREHGQRARGRPGGGQRGHGDQRGQRAGQLRVDLLPVHGQRGGAGRQRDPGHREPGRHREPAYGDPEQQRGQDRRPARRGSAWPRPSRRGPSARPAAPAAAGRAGTAGCRPAGPRSAPAGRRRGRRGSGGRPARRRCRGRGPPRGSARTAGTAARPPPRARRGWPARRSRGRRPAR